MTKEVRDCDRSCRKILNTLTPSLSCLNGRSFLPLSIVFCSFHPITIATQSGSFPKNVFASVRYFLNRHLDSVVCSVLLLCDSFQETNDF